MKRMTKQSILTTCAERGFEILACTDSHLYALLEQEYARQAASLMMVASSSIADISVLACSGTATSNVTTEGYPGARFHAGCVVVDQVEQLAIDRAKEVFRSCYANVQPHSGTTANQIVMCTLLQPGDTILGLDLDSGGHLTHGAKASISGQLFNAIGYGLNSEGYIDYDQVWRLAHEHHPNLIICGASSYPRVIDFQRFRAIADEIGAYLLADISHVAGLVAAGAYPSPIDHAHITTTSTYKQLNGPRGGLILMGRDCEAVAPDGKQSLVSVLQKGVFPFFQGTPNLAAIAAKAYTFASIATPTFAALAQRIVCNAQALAASFVARGYPVMTGGTDTHIVLMDVLSTGLTGVIAERALEECGIIVNKNRIPGDQKPPLVTSGLRLGTNSVARRGMDTSAMAEIGSLIDRVLTSIEPVSDQAYRLDAATKESVQLSVALLCTTFPIPDYPI